MSFRTDLLKNVVLPLLRLPGPTSDGGIFDVYTYSIVVRTRTWASGKVGTDVSTATVSDLALLPRPRVREDGDKFLVVEGIVASNPKGGYTLAQLRPTTSAGVEYYYRVTGANGTHAYELIDVDTSSAFLYSLRLQALTRATPF